MNKAMFAAILSMFALTACGGGGGGGGDGKNDPVKEEPTDKDSAKCVDECGSGGALECAGNGFRACERGAGGCLAWAPILACAQGTSCQGAGTCKKPDGTTGCDTCPEGQICNGLACVSLAPSVAVSVKLDLFEQGGKKVLPIYVSHLYSDPDLSVANVALENTGSSAVDLKVTIDLPTYGAPASRTIKLAAGEKKNVPVTPILDYDKLFQNTTAVPGTVAVTVSAGALELFAQGFPIQISGRNTVFWSNGDDVVVPLVSTMVTPQDKHGAIQTVIRGAADRFPGGSMVGYQGGAWPAGATALSHGDVQTEEFFVRQGESPSVSIESVEDEYGNDSDVAVYIFPKSEFAKWMNDESAVPCGMNESATGGSVVRCQTPAQGMYVIAYYRFSADETGVEVTRSRPMTQWEVAYLQTAAIFYELRDRGLVYVNIPGTGFLSDAQHVRYPVESVAVASANCIDGSLVFASAWEALGMEPVLIFSFQAGHAFAAVRCWANATDCLIPVETTMMGDESKSFDDAYNSGLTTAQAWGAGGHLIPVDIKQMRAQGLTPAPM